MFIGKIRQHTADGHEFWSTRDLQAALGYNTWDKFLRVITKAVAACEGSGHSTEYHFSHLGKMVEIGSGARRTTQDYRLSRYACYLIVQNGDPSKPIIANGQTYFALQTRRQELQDDATFQQLNENQKRVLLRDELTQHNKQLAATAQTDDKLRRDNIKEKHHANQAHQEVGAKVRKTIADLGGTMPEQLPTPKTDIKALTNQHKKVAVNNKVATH